MVAFVEFGLILVLQEMDPWNSTWTILPVLLFSSKLVLLYYYRGRHPPYDIRLLRKGAYYQIVAFVFFVLGNTLFSE